MLAAAAFCSDWTKLGTDSQIIVDPLLGGGGAFFLRFLSFSPAITWKKKRLPIGRPVTDTLEKSPKMTQSSKNLGQT